jgi:hypothetical protein
MFPAAVLLFLLVAYCSLVAGQQRHCYDGNTATAAEQARSVFQNKKK